jgi:transcriptional regulator PpsR
VIKFESVDSFLDGLSAGSVSSLIAASSDVVLIVDQHGLIQDLALGGDDWAGVNCHGWLGRPWAETVTVESRPKVAALLRDAVAPQGASRKWRHINYAAAQGEDVPVSFVAVKAGGNGAIVAFGRDMRPLATLQQRLVATQQHMEQDYLRVRHLESRYRLLFQKSSEACVIVDAGTLKIVEANPAAAQLIGVAEAALTGRAFVECLDADDQSAVTALLQGVRATGAGGKGKIRFAAGGLTATFNADILRQEKGAVFVLRMSAVSAGGEVHGINEANDATLRAIFDSAPDAMVVTDLQGNISAANEAFLQMTQMAALPQIRGESLDRWLGRQGVDLSVLVANLKERGSVSLFAAVVRGEHGATTQVEISATFARGGKTPSLGFTIRDVGRRLELVKPAGKTELPRSVTQLKELVGRVPMKDIVTETSDMIEQLCLEAALELTLDNRAAAAELLGLSRQSLYVKLRRYGLGDLAA